MDLNNLKNNLFNIKLIIFDFDGVWTDNKVITDSNGIEYVTTSRSDSWGLNIFKKYCKEKNFKIDLIVMTTETNNVVIERCKKLDLKCYPSTKNKLELLKKLSKERNLKLDKKDAYDEIIFVGNDLNDIEAMKACKISASPIDSNEEVLKISKFVGNKKGGDGFVREFFEWFIKNTAE